jgi:uncharacterized protein YbaR (Trm112 family)
LKKNSSKLLQCVNCSGKIKTEILDESSEIIEGFLVCTSCKGKFPIINGIPIMMKSFTTYLQSRTSLGGILLSLSKSQMMKNFIKSTLSKLKKSSNDLAIIEKRWETIYKKNRNSLFYTKMLQKFSTLPHSKFVLEHGSSIGIISKSLAQKHDNVFGIDSSFHAIVTAKENSQENVDFFVSDSLFHPFGKKKFDIVLALNMLELIEPVELLGIMYKQVKHGYIIISDPYDYDRGKNSVRTPLYENDIRKKLHNLGLSIVYNTKKPNYFSWNLKINSRTSLNYKVDLVIGKKC